MEPQRVQKPSRILAVLCALLVGAAACAGEKPDRAGPPSRQSGSPVSPQVEGNGKAELTATARVRDLGPIRASVTDPQRAPNAWLAHELRLTNGGDATVYLDDTRESVFLGDGRQILVGVGEGCGYGSSGPGADVEPACHSDLRPVEIPAGGSVTFPLTLWKGLPGMGEPGDGPFTLEHGIRYRMDAAFTGGAGSGAGATTGTVVVRYTRPAA